MSITTEPLVLTDAVVAELHRWVTHPRAVFWQMGDASPDDVRRAYAELIADPHHQVLLGRVDGVPAFLAELYDPRQARASEIAQLDDLEPGDLGMHVLLAPPRRRVPGHTRAVFAAVLDACFADPAVRRVVVEPDVENAAIARRNAEAGFRVVREIPLATKTAAFSVLDRATWEQRRPRPDDHLTPATLAAAQRHLVTKALAEFAHERILAPRADGDGWVVDGLGVEYRFAAEQQPLDHWAIDPSSVERLVDGRPTELDVQQLVLDLADLLPLGDGVLPLYLEELATTLAGRCWRVAHPGPSARELADAEHLTIEAAMTEGHPGFVANSGRIGFGLTDQHRHSPESAAGVRLVWLAARRTVSRLSLGEGVEIDDLLPGKAARDRFDARLRGLGLDPADYHLLPVHPWQWEHTLATTFAPDLARRDLVHLGEDDAVHVPLQSLRTLADAEDPARPYVKTAVAVRTMGFTRGLSPAYMAHTPAINDWVHDLVAGDAELRSCGFEVLRERAAIGYTGDVFHASAATASAPQRKMVAALWRENVSTRLAEGERAMTMAALLHRDPDGVPVVRELIEAAGAEPSAWIADYLRAYVRPLVHCLLAHDLAFMPHGENVIVVLRGHRVVRTVMKDIGEEIGVLSDRPLPAACERVRMEVGDDERALPILTDVVDGYLRHLAALLDDDGLLEVAAFWRLVRDVVDEHAADHPALAEAATRYALTRPRFRHSCLNRLQLRDPRTMVALDDQAASFLYAGWLENPLA
ncbi:GNAT family N-acetyltransferase [Nocardioides fonticola]|uniref:GNAT family N-acetyltransferase n=1 Tax=Nocardioides fonticola TaxID=450363 RepID=UPI0031DC1F16